MPEPIPVRHVVAMPYPGRGHINPMLNLCHLILKSQPSIIISFIVTEEWLGFLRGGSEPLPSLRFVTVPNVLPSEIGRAKDFVGFFEAALTKLEEPVEELLDRLEPPKPSVIVYDAYLSWVVGMGNRRNIPVACFYPMSATVFSIFYHSELLLQNRDFSISDSSEEAEEQMIMSNIPGVPSLRFEDLPTLFTGKGRELLPRAIEAAKLASTAKYLLFASLYELEPQVLETLRLNLPNTTIHSLGLAIPYVDIQKDTTAFDEKPLYIKWLDAQPANSVMYISQGSFLSVSKAQVEEIMAGVLISGVRFFLVGREEAGWPQDHGNGRGIVVPWCDQLKVLCHSSVGGFWSHCGWNSTKEGAFAGVPMLTFPIFWDQVTNSKLIVEDWKIGLRVKREDEVLVTREEVAALVLRVMNLVSDEGKAMRSRGDQIREICRRASAERGSSESGVDAFVRDIFKENDHFV